MPICPCGYQYECGIWCGFGHTTGLCPAWQEEDCDCLDWIDPW